MGYFPIVVPKSNVHPNDCQCRSCLHWRNMRQHQEQVVHHRFLFFRWTSLRCRVCGLWGAITLLSNPRCPGPDEEAANPK